MFMCDPPSALLAEGPRSFTCHGGNTWVEWAPNKSQHRQITLEKKFIFLSHTIASDPRSEAFIVIIIYDHVACCTYPVIFIIRLGEGVTPANRRGGEGVLRIGLRT